MSVDAYPHNHYKGFHGTCKSYARDIEKLGFRASAGRHGRGAYFWIDKYRAFDLAICFSRDQRRNYDRGARDSSEVVIECDILFEESGVLDLTDRDISESFHLYSASRNEALRRFKGSEKDKSNVLINGFIEEIEESSKITIQAVTVMTMTPNSYRESLSMQQKWAGLDRARCLLVRDLSTIQMDTIDLHL